MTRLIDADALKNTFKDKEGNEFTAFHFYDAIDNAPTVERPHGEWKPSWSNLNESYCSCCNFTVRNELKSYFCPKCGSDNRPRGEVK